MTFTKQEKEVLKALVEQELSNLKKQGEKFMVGNSPVLSGIYRMKDTDLSFLKTTALYHKFLEDLSKKL